MTVLYAAPSLDTLALVPELASFQRAYPRVRVGVWVEHLAASHGTLSGLAPDPVPASVQPVASKRFWWSRPPTAYTLTLSSGAVLPLRQGRIAAADVAAWSAPTDDRLVLVCGPEGFVRAMAGDKGRDLVSQGKLRGILAALGYRPEQVVKL